MKIALSATINGQQQEVTVRSNQTLLEFLRDDLELKGSVEGCGIGVCGSCTVLVDGRPVSSCLMLATNAEGKVVTTIEGLWVGQRARPGATGISEASSVPMRLLHARDDHGGQRIARQ